MKRKKLGVLVFLSLGLLGIHNTCMAQETGDDVYELGEIVVEGTSGVQDIAINNTVTAGQIKTIGATNAAQALEYVPGVSVITTSKGEKNINIQGFGQKDIMVLIDGVPYYETKNGPLDLQQIPAGIISRIDVTKGASSVLYGPNALGGVVNIVTKKGVKGTSGTVSAEAGRGGYGRGTATLNIGTENGFSMLGSVDYQNIDNRYSSNDYTPEPSSIKYKKVSDSLPNPRTVNTSGKKKNSDLESLNLWTRLGYNPTDNFEMYASFYRFDMEKGRPYSDQNNTVTPKYSSFGRYNDYKDTGIDLSTKFAVNDWLALRASTFYHSHEDEYESYTNEYFNQKIATSTWDDDAYGFSFFTDMFLNQYGALSLTAQYRNDEHKQKWDEDQDWEDSESNTLTLAAEDTISMGQFEFVFGLAYHHFDIEKIADKEGYTSDTIDPMAGLTWKGPGSLELFGSIARKTRFPTFNDMDYDAQLYRLDPETNINYTVGARYLFFDKTHVTLSGFFNDIKDGFSTKEDAAGDEYPVNIGKEEIYGIEFNTDTRITDRLSFGLDYVLTHARNKSDDRICDYLEDVPEYTLGARLSYMIPKIETQLTLKGTYKNGLMYDEEDPDEKEDYTVVDLSLIKDWGNGFSLGGYVYNLLDADYYDGKGMPCDGFDFKVVAKYSF